MATVSVKLSRESVRTFADRLNTLIKRSSNMKPVMQQAGEYLVRSTRHRIIRSKRSPSGKTWPPLKPSTLYIRKQRDFSGDQPLFQSGKLADSIYVKKVTSNRLEVAAEAPYASFQQNGVKRTGGMIKDKKIPARRFMGLSLENSRRISKMIREHLERN